MRLFRTLPLLVAIALLVMPNPTLFYLAWMVGILLLLVGWMFKTRRSR